MSKIHLPTSAFSILQLCAPSEPVTDSAPRYLLLEAEGDAVRLSITNGIAAARINLRQHEPVQEGIVLALPWDICFAVYAHAHQLGATQLAVTERAIFVEPCEFGFCQGPHCDPASWDRVFDPASALGAGNEFSAWAIMQLAERASLFSDIACCSVAIGNAGAPMVFRSGKDGIEFEGITWPGVDFEFPTDAPAAQSSRSLFLHNPE